MWFYALKIKWFEDMILCIQNQQLLPTTPIYMLEAVNVILYIYQDMYRTNKWEEV
jgi:hypothetical protein